MSVGPLLQFAVTGDLWQLGLSYQLKYWLDVPAIDPRLKVNLQAGAGLVHADFHAVDTSWVIPFGAGLDFALTKQLSLTSTFLLNWTDLHADGYHTHVMPGLTFGIRF